MSLFATIIYAIWLLSEILLNRLLRAKGSDRAGADKNSLGLIWLTIAVAITLSIMFTIWCPMPVANCPAIIHGGLLLIVLGVVLRLAVIRSLGRFFTVDVTIREGHRLKTDGIYRYLRHPSYAASLLSFIGFGLSLNNWWSLLLVTLSVFCAFLVRIRVEEQVLIGQFGQAYVAYRKKTKALVPFLF
jgi:protein-S-isoprenylcysteine O-methyltransferase Ste14